MDALRLLLMVAAPAGYVSQAPVALMIDTASGATLHSKNADRRIPTASMAKMMSAWVVFEALKTGEVKAGQKFQVSDTTWTNWNYRGSSMFLKAREQVSVEVLLHGMLTLSGNDASVVLAEGVAGSEADFVKRMNAEARKLGMADSHFANANGWPDGGQTYSTAHDLSLLATRIIEDHPALYRQYFGQKSFAWNKVMQPNRNPLLGAIAGADGLKTGHSDEAGYCLAGSAERGGRRVIMVIAGLDSQQGRMNEARKFMKWGFDAWQARPLFARGKAVARIPVQLGNDNYVAVVAPRNLATILPKGATGHIKLALRYKGPVRAPFAKGAELAQLVVTLPDGSRQVLPLVAAKSVGAAGFFGRAWNGAKSLVGA